MSSKPKRTIYFSFGHDEEIGGTRGNKKLAQYFAKNNVSLELVVDEGGLNTVGVFPGSIQLDS